jgi:hypothetical protein
MGTMKKGPRRDLKLIRNRKLIEKFYELHDLKRKRLDDVLVELETEHFFIDRKRIYAIIFYDKTNFKYYDELVAKTKQKKQNQLNLFE